MAEPEDRTISDDESERHAEKANEIGESAAHVSPDLKMWGIVLYGDAPGGVGGGVGCFLWFERRDRLLDFAANHLTFYSPGPIGIDPGRVSSEVKQIVKEIKKGGLTIFEAIPRLNSTLRHFSQIDWIGTFQDLVASPGEFERGVRRWYREQQEVDTSDAVITKKELKSFREAIAEYGM